MSKKREYVVKKFFAMLLILPLLLFTGCGKKEEKDKIVSLRVDQSFVSRTFYVGDTVDFSSYTLTLVHSLSPEESVPLSSATIKNFSTSAEGEIEVTISYAGIDVKVSIVIRVAAPVNIRYTGDGLVYYYGEGFDLENESVFVLYENNSEEEIALSDLELEDGGNGVATAKLGGLSVDIEYTKRYHTIEIGQEYKVNNPFADGEFVGEIIPNTNYSTLLVKNAETNTDFYPFTLIDQGDGHYETKYLFNEEFCTYDVYLANGEIQIVKKA